MTVTISNDWQYTLLTFLRVESILVDETSVGSAPRMMMLIVTQEGWARSVNLTRDAGCRFVAIWAKDAISHFQMYACFEAQGKYLLLKTSLEKEDASLASITPYYPAANRLERHIRDLYGIFFQHHPDPRRWIRHLAWEESVYPLRKDFQSELHVNSEMLTPPDVQYPFQLVEGHAMCEVPVGPVHAGIIEPGHFRFQIAGEDVFLLEEHLGYVHKGIEKIAEGRSPEQLIRLAGRVSGDSTVAYAWAASQACESAMGITIPPRAAYLRAILCERERIANHLWDIAAICNDVGFAFSYYQLGRLKELWQRLNANLFNHRLMMDAIVLGGVSIDINLEQMALLNAQHWELKKEFETIYTIITNHLSLQDRLVTTGVLTPVVAKRLGVLGYVGKASGIDYDLRRDAPCFPYDRVKVATFVSHDGDVAARLNVRAHEIYHSLELLSQLLDTLPLEAVRSEPRAAVNFQEGIGLIEGWRGEILVYVSFDQQGFVDRFFARDPSWFSWLALEELIHGNIVPVFPVCNKSINGSYSGVDL